MAGQKRSTLVDVDSEAFEQALREAVSSLALRGEGALVRLGVRVQNAARELCPVDTGRLRSSVNSSGLQRDGRGPYVEVGTNVEYARYVEFGTLNSRAQPYLRPALLEAAVGSRGGAGRTG